MTADDNDPVSVFSPGSVVSQNLDSSSSCDGACRLQDWGLILATGPDSASFLHGQLTQDILHLAEGQARLAGYCSAKGRLLATFTAWRTGPEQIALACSADLLAPTLKRLSMFVLRAKCKLSAGDDQWALYGMAGPAAAAWIASALQATVPAEAWATAASDRGRAIRLPSCGQASRWLWVQAVGQPAPDLPTLDRAAWNWMEVRAGVARVQEATVEQFVRQMVNLELTGGVNFQKGCYPGQEVVARSQYRGTLKRRMFLMSASGPISAGMEVHHSSDPEQPAGMVALAAPVPRDASGRHEALVECKSALLAVPGTWRAGEVVLEPGALPYAVPLEPA